MSRILVIPDLHQKIGAGETMLTEGLKLNPDRVVFLGDLFDDFYDKPEDAVRAALWLKKWRDRLGEKLVTLYGNHDLSYAETAHYLARYGAIPPDYKPAMWCSGYTTEKAIAIHQAVGLEFWNSWRLHHREDGVLYTHAGADDAQEQNLDANASHALLSVDAGSYMTYEGVHPLLLAGPARGGPKHCRPGITWRDFHEFDGSAPCPQVFGHTPRQAHVRFAGNGVCLDTGAGAFAMMEDGHRLQIVAVGDEDVQASVFQPDSRYAEMSRRHGDFLVRNRHSVGSQIGKGRDFTVDFPQTITAAQP